MITVLGLRQKAKDYKKTLNNKSGLKHIEEIRVWQKYAIDEFVEQLIKEYETRSVN